MLRIWSVSGQELAAVPEGDMFKDVFDLKCHLRSRHGFPVSLQQLLHAGRCLEDGACLVGPVDLQLVLFSSLRPEQLPQAQREFAQYVGSTGHAEVGRALLAAGVGKNLQDRHGAGALMLFSRHVEVVRLLLDADADTNLQGGFGVTPLMHASYEGRVEIVLLLLDAGADKNLQDDRGDTALTLASAKGNVEIVRLLLKSGADKDLQNRSCDTALMRASSQGHVEIVRLLLEAGANQNLQRMSGATALMLASSAGHVEIVSLLEAEPWRQDSSPERLK